MKKMGSLFAGIGGFDLGFERAGFEVAWCVEKDKNAQAVLRKRFPNAKIYGDITQVDPDTLERVDVICGGFPCQDLSVAGKRAGLAGERSGLFHDAMRIVRRLNPSVLVLENVTGLLSSNRGLDFAAVVREVGEGWDCEEVAWRVLNSQYFGVAQRRKRVFIVASSRIGCSEQVLALSEGMCGDPASFKQAGEFTSEDARKCFTPSGESDVVVGAIDCDIPKQRAQNARQGHYIPVSIQGNLIGRDKGGPWGVGASEGGPMYTLTKNDVHAVAFRKSKRAQSNTDHETWIDDGLSNTLNGFDTGDTRTTHIVATPMVVRRLTPVECERLQGFPDGWTDIGTPQKPTADGHRYKQLGNAVTVNVAEWIARRTAQCL
jgi:DNA (cytosine-5)-methyltransferase 1